MLPSFENKRRLEKRLSARGSVSAAKERRRGEINRSGRPAEKLGSGGSVRVSPAEIRSIHKQGRGGIHPPLRLQIIGCCSGKQQGRIFLDPIHRSASTWRKEMPKRRGHESQNQRRGGDLAGKRSQPSRRRRHLYLVLDDWEKGFSVHKIDADSFDSDSDEGDDQDAGVAVTAGQLPDPPALRLESPGDPAMSFATTGSKLFVVTDARCGQTPALVYDAETAGLAIGPAVPAQRRCGLSVVVAAGEMLYAFSPPARNEQHSFQVMSCALTGSHRPDGEEGWSWRSLRAPPPPFDSYEIIRSYAVHSDGCTIFMTTAYRDRPGLQKSTYSFNTKYCVWRWHPWVLPFIGQGYFDSELDAWVGLHKDGYICSCELPSDIGSETPIELGTMQLDWQMADDRLFCKDTERHLRASLAYMGRSKFCLVKSVMPKRAKAKNLEGDKDDCVLHMTMFGLKYNNKGDLRLTNHKSSRSYRVTRHTDFFPPVAFWL